MNRFSKALTCSFFTLLLIASIHSVFAQKMQQSVIQITDSSAVNPNEVSVAINPKNRDNVVVVGMQFIFPDGSPGITNYSWATTDGGESWNRSANPNPQRRAQGDDAVVAGFDGTFYRTYISFNGIRVERPKVARNGIFMTTTDNRGSSWSDPVLVVDHLNTVLPFEDKPWPAVDSNPDSPHFGNIYISWTRFDEYGSTDPADSTQIFLARAEQDGNGFDMPFRISDHGGNTLDDNNTVEGAVPSVGPNGEVYIAWSGPLGIVFDKSLDGGLTFGRDVHVANDPGGWAMDIDGIGRANGMPVTDVDCSDSPHRGRIYINWADKRFGDSDIFLAYSDDQGASWSAPIRVNADLPGNDRPQFFTWMAVDPTDGSINIAYYDRAKTTGTQTALTLSRSTDGGSSFSHYPIDLEPFETYPDIFFGDYLGVDAHNGRVAIAFQHFTAPKKLAVSVALFDFEE